MPGKQKVEYIICQRPPVTLTVKARKQLANVKPSIKVAELARIVGKLMRTSETGEKYIVIPDNSLKPGDTSNALTAKDAARMARNNPEKNISQKHIAKAA
jgi:hypothetical protein